MNPSPTDDEILVVLRTSSEGMKAKEVRSGVNELRGDDTRADFFRHRLQQLKKHGLVTSHRGPCSENIWVAIEKKETE